MIIDIIATAAYCVMGGACARYYSSFFAYKKCNIIKITAGPLEGNEYVYDVHNPSELKPAIFDAYCHGDTEIYEAWYKSKPIALTTGLVAFLAWPLFVFARFVWVGSRLATKAAKGAFGIMESSTPNFLMPEVEKTAKLDKMQKNIQRLEKKLLND